MPLTVADALNELQVFSEAQVVAGHKGLSRAIRWAHVMDVPDVATWVREGNLLLTTAFALKDNPEAQLDLIPSLVEKGLCGMVVAVGRYLDKVPQEMIRLADELDFPIITVPFEVPYVEVTQAIHQRILSEQYALLQQSLHIHKVLTQLVLEGKGLDALADTLATLLSRSVTIEDASLRLLAYASTGPVDEMRERSITERRTPEEMVAHLASHCTSTSASDLCIAPFTKLPLHDILIVPHITAFMAMLLTWTSQNQKAFCHELHEFSLIFSFSC